MSPCTQVSINENNEFTVEEEYIPSILASVKEERSGSMNWAFYNRYLNDFSDTENQSALFKFFMDIIKTLTFHYYFLSLKNAIHQRSLPSFIFRAIDGLIEWLAYMYQVIFPFSLAGFIVLTIVCY